MKPYLYDGVYIRNPSEKLKEAFTYYLYDYQGNPKTYKLYDYDRRTNLYKFPYGAIEFIGEYEDRTICKPLTVKLNNVIKLREDQEIVVNKFEKPVGILFSEPGSGKTVMGCELIARMGITTLILVPTVYLLNQWKERIQQFLGVTPGVLGDGNKDIREITISTFPSALNNLEDIKELFSFIIIDETHRIAADSYREVVHKLPARYKLGMTGTLERKDKLDFMIYAYLTKRIVKNDYNPTLKPNIVIINIPVRLKGANYVEALNYLSTNETVLNIQSKWLTEVYYKRYQLALSLRVAHIKNLSERLEGLPHKIITGSTPSKDRDSLNSELEKYRLILATNVLDEGADITDLDALHLLVPTNNIPKLIQRINRVTRFKEGKKTPIIFDYWFQGNSGKWNVLKQQQVRLGFYKEKGYKIFVR